MNDMVFDLNYNPVWCNTPASCREWLRKRLKTDQTVGQYKVRRHQDLKHVSVATYLGDRSDSRHQG